MTTATIRKDGFLTLGHRLRALHDTGAQLSNLPCSLTAIYSPDTANLEVLFKYSSKLDEEQEESYVRGASNQHRGEFVSVHLGVETGRLYRVEMVNTDLSDSDAESFQHGLRACMEQVEPTPVRERTVLTILEAVGELLPNLLSRIRHERE